MSDMGGECQIKWVKCPRCGREWPETNFPVCMATGERREICSCCLRNGEWRKDRRDRRRQDGGAR